EQRWNRQPGVHGSNGHGNWSLHAGGRVQWLHGNRGCQRCCDDHRAIAAIGGGARARVLLFATQDFYVYVNVSSGSPVDVRATATRTSANTTYVTVMNGEDPMVATAGPTAG